VERLDDGEVSPYLTDELGIDDELELRGPIGGPFTWRVQDCGPLVLIAGGSGVVPLMAMLRHHAAHDSAVDCRMLLSARTPQDIIYSDELTRLAQRDTMQISYTFTRTSPGDWTGFRGRISAAMLLAVAPPQQHARTFVCGPTAFVEHAADLLVSLGHAPAAIRTERFGPTGG
jgi:ferredoxin-NADP reductase